MFDFRFILIFINTTQLYSNLVIIIKYYLSVPCLGCPDVSKDPKGQACLAVIPSFLYLHAIQSLCCLASLSLILISEDKGGPTPGH